MSVVAVEVQCLPSATHAHRVHGSQNKVCVISVLLYFPQQLWNQGHWDASSKKHAWCDEGLSRKCERKRSLGEYWRRQKDSVKFR